MSFVVFACVNANSIHHYGWAPGTESKFRFESQVLNGIPEIRDDQFAGLKIMAEVRVQAFADYTLRIKMENIRYVTFNGVITMTDAQRIIDLGGQNSGAKEELLGELRTSLEEPILVHLKRGLIMDFFVSHNEPIAITNIKRSLLSQLQLNVSPGIENLNIPGDELVTPGKNKYTYYSEQEESILGKCRTSYSIFPLSQEKVVEMEEAWKQEEDDAHLTSSEEGKIVCQGKPYHKIFKTTDLDNCQYNPTFQHVANAEFSGDFSKSYVGDIQTVNDDIHIAILVSLIYNTYHIIYII